MALPDRLSDAFYGDPDEPTMERLRAELAALPEPKLRQLVQEFGQHVCSEGGVPEEDLMHWWEVWALPWPGVVAGGRIG